MLLSDHIQDLHVRGVYSKQSMNTHPVGAAPDVRVPAKKYVHVIHIPDGTPDNKKLLRGLCIPVAALVARSHQMCNLNQRHPDAPGPDSRSPQWGDEPDESQRKFLSPEEPGIGFSLFSAWMDPLRHYCNMGGRDVSNWAEEKLTYDQVLPDLAGKWNVQFFVIQEFEGRNGAVKYRFRYKYPKDLTTTKPTLYLLETVDQNNVAHCEPMTDFQGFASTVAQPCMYCEETLSSPSRTHRHICPKMATCLSCSRILQTPDTYHDSTTERAFCDSVLSSEAVGHCGTCDRRLASASCRRHHTPKVCAYAFRCTKCDKVKVATGGIVNARAGHICNAKLCRDCHEPVAKGSKHYCQIRKCSPQSSWSKLCIAVVSTLDSAVCPDCISESQPCELHSECGSIEKEPLPAVVAYCRERSTKKRGHFSDCGVLCSTFLGQDDVKLPPRHYSHMPPGTCNETPSEKRQRKLLEERNVSAPEERFPASTKCCADKFMHLVLGDPWFEETTIFVHCDERSVNGLSIFLKAGLNLSMECPRMTHMDGRLSALHYVSIGVRLLESAAYYSESMGVLAERLDPKHIPYFFPVQLCRRSLVGFSEPWDALPVCAFADTNDDQEERQMKRKFLNARQQDDTHSEWVFRDELVTAAVRGLNVVALTLVRRFRAVYQFQSRLYAVENYSSPPAKRELLSPFTLPIVSPAGIVYQSFILATQFHKLLATLANDDGVRIGTVSRAEIRLAVELQQLHPDWKITSAISTHGQFKCGSNCAMPDLVLEKPNGPGEPPTITAVMIDGCMVHCHRPIDGVQCPRFRDKTVNFRNVPADDVIRNDERKRAALLERHPEWTLRVEWECQLEARFNTCADSKAIWERLRRPTSRLNPRES